MSRVKVDSFKELLLLEPKLSRSVSQWKGANLVVPTGKQCDCAIESRGPACKEEGLITHTEC